MQDINEKEMIFFCGLLLLKRGAQVEGSLLATCMGQDVSRSVRWACNTEKLYQEHAGDETEQYIAVRLGELIGLQRRERSLFPLLPYSR